MSDYSAIMTDIGRQKQIELFAQGKTLTLAHIAFGDGNSNANPLKTALARERYRSPVNDIVPQASDPFTFLVKGHVPGPIGGFSISEVGVFDEDNTLIYLAKYKPTYKPTSDDGATEDMIFELYVTLISAADATIQVDPNVAMASRYWVETRLEPVIFSTALAHLDNMSQQITLNNILKGNQ